MPSSPAKNKEYMRALSPEKRRQYRQTTDSNLWNRVLDLLGRECACCGEDNLLFLTLDHKTDDAYKDRGRGMERGRDGRIARRRALREPHLFQILCYNCNCGRARNGGVCPHKELAVVGQ